MSKVVGIRTRNGIVLYDKPMERRTGPWYGEIRFYRKGYQEYQRFGMISSGWVDITDEVAAILKQTFAPKDDGESL